MRLSLGIIPVVVCCACVVEVWCGLTTSAAATRQRRTAEPLRAPATLHVKAMIGDQAFRLEVADDEESQLRGLGGRGEVARDGGMLFVFPDDSEQLFVMKDCATALDLLYLDGEGRVLSVHSMNPEAARGPDERAGDPAGEAAYEARLKGYASNGPARFAVEVAGGTLQRLRVGKGDVVALEGAAAARLMAGRSAER